MTATTQRMPGGLHKTSITRRGALIAGAGIAAGAFLRAAPVIGQNSEDAPALDWVDVFGNLHLAAAEFGGQVRGGVAYFQSLDAMIQAQILTAEIAAAIPSFLGALYTQYLTPDPNNASGATFSRTLGVAMFKTASVDDSRAARTGLQNSWESRADAKKLTEAETGVDGLTAYLIESTYAAANGNVPANYVNGVLVFGNLVVHINGVGYDADPVAALVQLAATARRLLRRVDATGASYGGLFAPGGLPVISYNLNAYDGKMIDVFEQTSEAREISFLVTDAEHIDRNYRMDFIWQPEEGLGFYVFHNIWVWKDSEDARRFLEKWEGILNQIDPGQNVTRIFEESTSQTSHTAHGPGAARALLFQDDDDIRVLNPALSGMRAYREAVLWFRQEEWWGGCEELWWHEEYVEAVGIFRTGHYYELGPIDLGSEGAPEEPTVEDWMRSPEHEELMRDRAAYLEAVRDGTLRDGSRTVLSLQDEVMIAVMA